MPRQVARKGAPIRLHFSVTDILGRTPAPIQTKLISCPAFEIGMITGFASGKTRGLCADSIIHCVKNPKAKVVLGRKTYGETIKNVKLPWFQMADPLYRAGWFVKPDTWDYREGTNLVRFVNGSEVWFSNFDEPTKFRNEEYSYVGVDQVEEISEEMWDVLCGRIRWAPVAAEAWKAVASANDQGQNWVWRRFVHDPELRVKNGTQCPVTPGCKFVAGHLDENGDPIEVAGKPVVCSTMEFFHATTLENQHNLAPRYFATLMSKSKRWKDQFIYAKMESSSGRLLPDPVVIPHFDPPKHWPRWRGIDHALSSPACCEWVTVNTDGHATGGVPPQGCYVYKEYFAGDRSVDQHARAILDMSRGETYRDTVIDRSVYRKDQNRTGGMRVSIADLYVEEGLYVNPSQGDPFARVERINQANSRGLLISNRCPELIRMMPRYEADAINEYGIYKIINKSIYHAVDAVGYALMMIPTQSISDEELASGIDPQMREELDALDKTDDEATLRHRRGEWRRNRKHQQQILAATSPAALGSMMTSEFLSNDEGDDRGEAGTYDPVPGLW